MNRFVLYLVTIIACVTAVQASALTTQEESDLLFMREEEKLARDVYVAMDGLWQHNIFTNIAESEERHMDAMLRMIQNYGLQDPVGENPPGVFNNQTLTELYAEQTSAGQDSLLAALKVGAYIEELDIFDLRIAIERTSEEPLIRSYSNLLSGSRNHLRSFFSHILAQGGSYEPQVLSQDDFDEITDGFSELPSETGNFSINPGLNDAWFYPETNGQGFVVTVFPGIKRIFLAWFTYDVPRENTVDEAVLGHIDQRWFTAEGTYSGAMAELEVYNLEGGVFDDGDPAPVAEPHGSILLHFDGCNSGSVTYDLLANGRVFEGFIPIQRVNTDNVARCLQIGVEEDPG